jgi:putrescine transport system substrate-binding protein
MLAIPADAEHKDAAMMFINFVLQPDVMAGITNTVRYANAVPASRPMIRPELLADTNIFPTPEQMKSFFTVSAVPPAVERRRSRMWARFKAGQ